MDLEKRKLEVVENIKRIFYEVEKACERSDRNPEEVQVMAVTKTVDPVLVNVALEAGVKLIGENRVQEFLGKKDQYSLKGTGVHFIGHLQSNKVRQIVELVDTIQTVDSVKLASEIDKRSKALGKVMDVLVQVNISREESKSGVMAENLHELLCELSGFKSIQVQGLMTIPAFDRTKEENKQTLEQMYQLFIDMQGKNVDNINMYTLSMGMSGDYVDAIESGSNLVRIGSSMFGKRVY